MGFIGRLKSTRAKKNNNVKSEPSLPVAEVVVIKAKSNAQQPILANGRHRGIPSANKHILAEELVVLHPRRDTSQDQRMYVDRLFNIGNQFVRESLDKGERRTKATNPGQSRRKDMSGGPPKRTTPARPRDDRPANFLKEGEMKEEESDHVDSGEPCTLIDMFSGGYLCGGCSKIEEDTRSEPRRPSTLEEEKETELPERPVVLPVELLPEFPSTISFEKRRESSWVDNHVLLTEIDEDASLDSSLISRLRKLPWTRKPNIPKTQVYVEAPRRVSSDRSAATSVLTGPFH